MQVKDCMSSAGVGLHVSIRAQTVRTAKSRGQGKPQRTVGSRAGRSSSGRKAQEPDTRPREKSVEITHVTLGGVMRSPGAFQ